MTPSKPDRGLFLEISPYEADAGQLIGKDPRQIPVADIRRLELPESPSKAIRPSVLIAAAAMLPRRGNA
jgi:hypothetical protein